MIVEKSQSVTEEVWRMSIIHGMVEAPTNSRSTEFVQGNRKRKRCANVTFPFLSIHLGVGYRKRCEDCQTEKV